MLTPSAFEADIYVFILVNDRKMFSDNRALAFSLIYKEKKVKLPKA
jgi:hypothetical protein